MNEKKAHLLQEAVLARSPKVADLITNDAKVWQCHSCVVTAA